MANTLTYDPFGRLATHTRASVTTTYTVNALDQRVSKAGSAVADTTYIYGGPNQLLAERNANGWTSYLWNGNEPVVLVRNNQLYYLHTDHLGRPQLATNASRTVVWKANYTAFNRTVSVDSIGGFNFGNPGQYLDTESGLWHNGYRDYDWTTGRYLQSDPIGLAGGINTYVYALGNPILVIDPFGLCWEYSQSTGTLTYVDDKSGERTVTSIDGYAGHGEGVNAPDKQDQAGVGPLPRGDYTIQPQRNNVTGTGLKLLGSMRLTPAPTNTMYGRAGFLIHGDNRKGDKSASEGCIVLSRSVRDKINQSGDSCLKVVQ